MGPALVVTLLLILIGIGKSQAHRRACICLGNAPASASHVQVTGHSTFLHAEWLAVFNVGPKDFQTLVAGADLVPVDDFEFSKMLEQSFLKKSRLYQSQQPLNDELCFKRVFKEGEEHEIGGVYAAFDPATYTAIVLRGYKD